MQPRRITAATGRAGSRRLGALLLLGAAGLALALPRGAGAAAGPAAPAPAPQPPPAIRAVTVATTDARVAADDGSEVALDRVLTIEGSGFYGTSFGPSVRFRLADGSEVEAPYVFLQGADRLIASPPRGTRGQLTLIVENPDHASASVAVGL